MASNPQHEPTMEEILASIRKIISEDSNEGTPAASASSAAGAPAQIQATIEHEETDVLELTQEVPQEEPVKPEPVKPEPVKSEPVKLAAVPPAPKPVVEPENDIEFQTVEEAAVSSSAPADDDIFSDKTRKAIDETFSRIEAPKADEKPAAAPRSFTASAGASVEAVFERAVSEAFDPVLHQWMDANKSDLLAAVKPLIREWMDEHFPALLEGAVRNEVERVVRARGR
jgi:cell pole-organizing protein PopZ